MGTLGLGTSPVSSRPRLPARAPQRRAVPFAGCLRQQRWGRTGWGGAGARGRGGGGPYTWAYFRGLVPFSSRTQGSGLAASATPRCWPQPLRRRCCHPGSSLLPSCPWPGRLPRTSRRVPGWSGGRWGGARRGAASPRGPGLSLPPAPPSAVWAPPGLPKPKKRTEPAETAAPELCKGIQILRKMHPQGRKLPFGEPVRGLVCPPCFPSLKTWPWKRPIGCSCPTPAPGSPGTLRWHSPPGKLLSPRPPLAPVVGATATAPSPSAVRAAAQSAALPVTRRITQEEDGSDEEVAPENFSPSLRRPSRLEVSHTLTPFPRSQKSRLQAPNQSRPSRTMQPVPPWIQDGSRLERGPWVPEPGGDYGCDQFSTFGNANAAGAYYQDYYSGGHYPAQDRLWSSPRRLPQRRPSSMTKHLSSCRAKGTEGGRSSILWRSKVMTNSVGPSSGWPSHWQKSFSKKKGQWPSHWHEVIQQKERWAANRPAMAETPDYVSDSSGWGTGAGTEEHLVREQAQPPSDPSQMRILGLWTWLPLDRLQPSWLGPQLHLWDPSWSKPRISFPEDPVLASARMNISDRFFLTKVRKFSSFLPWS